MTYKYFVEKVVYIKNMLYICIVEHLISKIYGPEDKRFRT